MNLSFPFDLEESKRSGVFISGISGSGKTNLCKILSTYLKEQDLRIVVFDPSEAWYDSNIPNYQNIIDPNSEIAYPDDHIVYILSYLYPYQQKHIIQQIVQRYFHKQVYTPKDHRRQYCFIFEEAQMLIPQGNLRSLASQEILRLITVGRNFNLRYILLTQRPSLVDTTCIALCGQKYLGKTDEENDKKKCKNWIQDYAQELDMLNVGEFIYDKGNYTVKIQTPLFTRILEPQEIKISPKRGIVLNSKERAKLISSLKKNIKL